MKAKDNSVDPKIFDRWHDTVLATLRTADPLQPFEIEPEFRSASAVLGGSAGVEDESRMLSLSVTAYRGQKIDYARLVRISGAGFNVFNFVALPNPAFDLPVFGVDVVVMAGNTLASIDFQPLGQGEAYLNGPLYAPFSSRLGKWGAALPKGRPLPEDMQPYFSPLALWTQFPPQDTAASLFLLGGALSEYAKCYAELLGKSEWGDEGERRTSKAQYLQFRTDRDPARRVLAGAFGAAWTERLLSEAVFPQSL
ncbi:ferredoxin-dependent bilin reductase [Ochromonadaceae sp. CCMP2298]|nr:ferredoxin-dependent bilin reductase [Ochromonadaceae sp. CCMP2298]